MAFDAIVAGAGIIGGSIAWRLAQRGLRVLLLDAGRMGGEASSAGAGMLAPGGEIEALSPWHELARESLRLYPAFVAELESETGEAIDFQRQGAIDIAMDSSECAALADRARVQAGLGIPSWPLPADEVRRRVPHIRQEIAAGWFYPEDALVDPRHVMRALRSACERRGVDIREGVSVTGMRPAADAVEVVTAEATFVASAAVLAAGAWSSLVPLGGLSVPRSFPVRGHLVGFHLEPGSLGPILRRGHTYLLQRAEGLTIAGTSSEHAGFDRALDPVAVADICRRAGELLPVLQSLLPSEQWLGFRPAAEAEGPVVGRAGETALWLAYGHYRNGILLAPATAVRLVAAITASSERDSSGIPGRR